MASSNGYKDFVLEQLQELDNITCRPMMGEFLLYYRSVLFGGIYDDRLLIKKTSSNSKYMLSEEIPYKNGKPMFMVDNLDDVSYLKDIIITTYKDLVIK